MVYNLTFEHLEFFFNLKFLFSDNEFIHLFNFFFTHEGLSLDHQHNLLKKDMPDLYRKLLLGGYIDED